MGERLRILKFFILCAACIIGFKLFQLQVVQGSHYRDIANRNHIGNTELPARRGEIIVQGPQSEEYRLATNITLDLLFADPSLLENKEEVLNRLMPHIFNLEEEREIDKKRVAREISEAKTEEELDKITAYTDDELKENFRNALLDKIKSEKRSYVLLYETPEEPLRNKVESFGLAGVNVETDSIWINPKEIVNVEHTSRLLSPVLEIPVVQLKRALIGKNRYAVLKRKLPPETSKAIRDMIKQEPDLFWGIALREEYFRFYPEKELAAQIVGFVNHTNNGQYGIELSFNEELKGENGIFISSKDGVGNHITVGDSVIKPAVDGNDVILTIDRTIQLEVDKMLKRRVIDTRAEQGQAVVMNPKTGAIIALSHYPTFDPNKFGDAIARKELILNEDEEKLIEKRGEENPTFHLYIDREKDEKIQVFPKELANGKTIYEMFKNRVGAGAYRNRVASDLYEPGSVFKVLTMAAGLDAQEVSPYTQVNETGPIDIDFNVIIQAYEHKIKNALNQYRGLIDMTQVLQYSSNVGISFVTRKLGKNLFYEYIQKYGFGKRTDIEFLGEEKGKIVHPSNWSESDFLTRGFGQGISATPIQLITALAALANDGVMMKPHIVKAQRIKKGNKATLIKTEPKVLRRIVTKETAETITAMMVNAVEQGIINAQVSSHYIAGKTGTSQTYKYGRPLVGVGTTITSMGGYGPANDPKFVILVKIDRPKQAEWGSVIAAPLFRDIGAFLYSYYNIPPDKK